MTDMTEGKPVAHPWRRYGARVLDAYVLGEAGLILAVLPFVFIWPDAIIGFVEDERQWKSLLVYTPLMWMAAMPANAALTRWLGVTPGKWIFGLRIVASDGIRPAFRQLMKREANVLLWGVGLGLPLISLGMLIRSYAEVEDGSLARWDVRNATRVAGRPARGLQLAGIIVGAAIVVILLAWGLVSRLLASMAV